MNNLHLGAARVAARWPTIAAPQLQAPSVGGALSLGASHDGQKVPGRRTMRPALGGQFGAGSGRGFKNRGPTRVAGPPKSRPNSRAARQPARRRPMMNERPLELDKRAPNGGRQLAAWLGCQRVSAAGGRGGSGGGGERGPVVGGGLSADCVGSVCSLPCVATLCSPAARLPRPPQLEGAAGPRQQTKEARCAPDSCYFFHIRPRPTRAQLASPRG